MVAKAVIFDLWNTLAYNRGVKVNPMVMLEEKLGLNMNLYREVELGFMTMMFKTRKEAVISLCRHIGVKPTERLVDTLVYLWSDMPVNITFFPDVIPALKRLRKRYRLGLVSNTECFSLKEFINRGYRKYFDFAAFSCELGLLKPDPKIFRLIMQKLGSRPDETVMVGDNLRDDVLAAEKLGVRGVLIKRDFEKSGAKPSWIEFGEHKRMITNLTELEKVL
jgi:putative hydrolase of the HAD superfamily